MNFNHTHYIPCLQWKLGEYQAVFRLPATTKRIFTPLIEAPKIGYDFEKKKESKTIDKHLEPFAKRIHNKWGKRHCFIDLNRIKSNKRMKDGIHPVRFVFDSLRAKRSLAVPVTGLDRGTVYQKEVKRALSKDNLGVCLRISIEQAEKSSLKKEIDSLLSILHIQSKDCDLIIDLGAPNFEPLNGFSKVIQAIVSEIPYLRKWRTFSVLGTSFPKTMAGIKLGVKIIPRHEWQLYKILVNNFKKANLRLPTFGDYAISNPNVPDLDWRAVKPSVKIRYTIDDSWYVAKGKNYRDYGYGQYYKLSKKIFNSDFYYGPTFSWGDGYLYRCANGGETGSLTMWLEVDTNHHIEKVTQDIASFYAS